MEVDLDFVASLGLATKGDIEALIKKLPEERYRQQVLFGFSGVTDGTGKTAFRVYDVPDGMQLYVAKYLVLSDAHNPSTGGCFQSTSCYGAICHGIFAPVNFADYFPPPSGGLGEATTPNIIPFYKEFNKFDAPEFQSPDNVAFGLVNGPANTNITCLGYGWLEEIREGRRFPKRSRRGRLPLNRRRERIPAPELAGMSEDATLG